MTEQPETDEQRADRLETERNHAAGDHQYCGVTCEAEMPSDMLRNFILAKGYPSTAGALDELLRRAALTPPDDAAVSQPDREAGCSARPCNPAADELCDRHARIRYHAEGEHAFCDPGCTEGV